MIKNNQKYVYQFTKNSILSEVKGGGEILLVIEKDEKMDDCELCEHLNRLEFEKCGDGEEVLWEEMTGRDNPDPFIGY